MSFSRTAARSRPARPPACLRDLRVLGARGRCRACSRVLADVLVTFPYHTNFAVARTNGDFYCSAVARDGTVQAVITTGLDLAWLSELAARAQLPPGSTITIVDGKGRVLARAPGADRWLGKTLPSEADLLRAVRGFARAETAEAIDLDGERRLLALTRLRGAMADGRAPSERAFDRSDSPEIHLSIVGRARRVSS